MFVTSSFQSQSIVLLHLVSQIQPQIPVYFIHTGYHFPETIVHKNKVASLLGLHVVDLKPLAPKSLQRSPEGNLLFTFDPDYCCYLNKIQPLERMLGIYDIWINGIRACQSTERSHFSVFEETRFKARRYHPLLHWSQNDIDAYILEHKLPLHPLETQGYKSIGCEPCTRMVENGTQRDGRWYGMKKTECGLHTSM